METIEHTVTLNVMSCAACHIRFAIPEDVELSFRRTHESFYCPRGHALSFKGESDVEKAERLRRKAERVQNDGWAAFEAVQDQLRASERSKAALKGQLTKARKKIANGVCPVGNCRRHFDNVQEHIASQHPSWHVTDPETGRPAVL